MYHGNVDVPASASTDRWHVANDTEFRKATEAEASGVARNPPPAPEPQTDASAPQPTVGDAATSDASVGPAPTCGVPGLECRGTSTRYKGTCESGATCKSGGNTCVAN